MVCDHPVHLYHDADCSEFVAKLESAGVQVFAMPVLDRLRDTSLSFAGVRAVLVKVSDLSLQLKLIKLVRTESDALVYAYVQSIADAEKALKYGVDGILEANTSLPLFSLSLNNAICRYFGLPRQLAFDFSAADVAAPFVSLDIDRLVLNVNGEAETLTRAEYTLMKCLLAGEGRVIARDELLDCLADQANVSSPGTLDTLIYRLRKKVAKHLSERPYIITVPSVGFRLEIN